MGSVALCWTSLTVHPQSVILTEKDLAAVKWEGVVPLRNTAAVWVVLTTGS